jgi:glutamate synthase domain-containing protein 2
MSVSSYQNNINRLNQQIADLLKKQNAERKKQVDLSGRISDLSKKMLSTSSLSTAQSYQRQAQTKEKELVRIERKIGDFEKQLAAKRKELSRNQENLKKALDQDDKKRGDTEKAHLRVKGSFNRQELNHVRSLNTELERQQNLFSSFSNVSSSSLRDDTDYSLKELIELNERIDNVLNKLEKLGMGQEILFEEIENLKEKGKKVSKKDLGLILIGQLVSFGAGKIDSETIKFVFENITGIDLTKMIQ